MWTVLLLSAQTHLWLFIVPTVENLVCILLLSVHHKDITRPSLSWTITDQTETQTQSRTCHTSSDTLDTISGRGHLQGISKPERWKSTEWNRGSFVSSLGARLVFSYTHSLSLTHSHTHNKASAIKTIYGFCSMLHSQFCFDNCAGWVASLLRIKDDRTKIQGGVAERTRGAQHAWRPKVRSSALWQDALWGMTVSDRDLPHLPGPVNLAAIIYLSLVKYKYCKSQRDPAPLGGLHLSATDPG